MYGGRSDDLEYMQEVLKTAERVGDKAYIQRLKNQIEEIKKRQTQPTKSTKPTLATSKKIAKKEEPLKTSEAKTVGKLGDRCTPIVNRGVPGSCETGTVCWSGVNRCCSRHASGEFYDCGETGISPIKGSPTKVSPVPLGPRAPLSSPVPASPSTPIHITDGKMTASPTTMSVMSPTTTPILPTTASATTTTSVMSPTPILPTTALATTTTSAKTTASATDSDKKVIGDYFNLKMSILKNIQELQKLKIQKDKLLNVVGYTPQLVFHNKQTVMDDCIRDESGKVLQC